MTALFGRWVTAPGKPETFGANDPISSWVDSKGFVARTVAKVLTNREKSVREKTGQPDLNTLFILNMPPRAMSKMTQGMIDSAMVQAIVKIANRHTFRGIGSFIAGFFRNQSANKRTEKSAQKRSSTMSEAEKKAYSNPFMAWWMPKWNEFCAKYPKLSKWVYQIFYFFVFSMGVTIVQYLIFTFLPPILGIGLAGTEFMWPQVDMNLFGVDFTWSLLGYNVVYDSAGAVAIGGGLGYFISYEVGSFIAQCINFPLQRNITFKSHGNPVYQAMWYFIAWVLISLICNGFNNLWMPIAQAYVPLAVYNILVTFITGGVSMVIFFFVFKIIFPEGEAKKDEAK